MSFEHKEELVATFDPSWGELQQIIRSWDNRVVGFVAGKEPLTRYSNRIVFNGEVLHKTETAWEMVRTALSFDGTTLAVGIPEENGRWNIYFNGEEAYEVEEGLLFCLVWINEDDLAWWVILDDEQHTSVFYVNGDRMMYGFALSFEVPGRKKGVFVMDPVGEAYLVYDSGGQSDVWEADPDDLAKFGCPLFDDEPEVLVLREMDSHCSRVAFQGWKGPAFDAIWSSNQAREFAFTEDETRVGYVALKYDDEVRKAHLAMCNLINPYAVKAVEHAQEMSWLYELEKMTRDNGALGLLLETTARYFPVVNGTPWKIGFPAAWDPFFTPSGKLIVTVGLNPSELKVDEAETEPEERLNLMMLRRISKTPVRGFAVAIDEEVGPEFDEIMNVRYIHHNDDGYLCYLGRRGNEFYRVTVELD